MKLWEQAVKGKERKGFTLIEVLIVVVIIGVLAALVIPRFVSAPEKAIVAEASQMLGSMIRAQNARIDTGAGFITNAAPLNATAWTALGMVAPTTSKFTYACSSPSCTATRTVTVLSVASFNATTNAWGCTGNYTTLANGGCTVA
ncbi:MAG: prepilin-type N-terminal cleavage/methylation domain-containing protein [Candidatus Omnitrophota bacterium]